MDNLKEIGGGDGMRPVFVHRTTGYLLTNDPATGEHVPLLDARTRKPITRRMVYVDALTGCYNAIDMKTGDVAEVLDPATGKPMLAKWPEEEPAEQTQGTAASAEVGEPDVPDEQALAQADADDASALEFGPSRRDDEPSLMELIEQMEEEIASEQDAEAKAEPAVKLADEPAAPAPPTPPTRRDYLQSLPHIDTRNITRDDGADIATLLLVALVIVIVIIGQMLYWALA